MILEWNKGATFNFVLMSHVDFIIKGASLIEQPSYTVCFYLFSGPSPYLGGTIGVVYFVKGNIFLIHIL